MKNGRKPKRKNPSPRKPTAVASEAVDSIQFLRLCHTCLYLNEAQHPIQECQQCTHRFAYTLDELRPSEWHPELEAPEEDDLSEGEKPNELLTGLTGLSVRW